MRDAMRIFSIPQKMYVIDDDECGDGAGSQLIHSQCKDVHHPMCKGRSDAVSEFSGVCEPIHQLGARKGARDVRGAEPP